MSDTLDVSPAPAANTPATATEVDTEVTDAEGAESAPAADGDAGKPARDRTQERIDQLTREKYEAFSERDRERYQRETQRESLQQQIDALKAEAKPQTVAPSNDYPTLESVGYDESKHATAIAQWVRTQAADAARQELTKGRETAERQQSFTTFKQAEAEFIKTNPEYVEKVQRASTLPISEEAQARLSRLGDGPRLALALVENRDKAMAIMHLPIDVQMLEIGRIAGRIEAIKAAPPPVSKAPPPVAKIEAQEVAATDSIEDIRNGSQAKFNKWRQKYIGKK